MHRNSAGTGYVRDRACRATMRSASVGTIGRRCTVLPSTSTHRPPSVGGSRTDRGRRSAPRSARQSAVPSAIGAMGFHLSPSDRGPSPYIGNTARRVSLTALSTGSPEPSPQREKPPAPHHLNSRSYSSAPLPPRAPSPAPARSTLWATVSSGPRPDPTPSPTDVSTTAARPGSTGNHHRPRPTIALRHGCPRVPRNVR